MKQVPRSVATNSYELVDELIFLIEEDNRRLYMRNFISVLEGDSRYALPHYHSVPECGMVACIAGWIAIVRKQPKTSYVEMRNYHIQVFAMLQFPEEVRGEIDTLFFEFPPLDSGTPEYVDWIVRRLRAFQIKNADELRNYKLPELDKATELA